MSEQVPDGFAKVSTEEFYRRLYADPRDIMPNHTKRDYTTWETKSREVWGWSEPGWANPGGRKQYAIAKPVAA